MMKKGLLFLIALLLFVTGNLRAEIVISNSSAGNLEALVKAAQPDLAQVTELKITGNMDARDFRFLRDSLNASLTSLDISGVSIVAYSGMGGTEFTPPPAFGTGGGADVNAVYQANVVPNNAFYKKWTEGSMLFSITVERKMTRLATLKLPVNIKTLGNYSLAGISPLSSLNLNDLTLLETIGNYAFFKAGIVSIVFPGSVTLLGQGVFNRCTDLTTVTIPATVDSISIYPGIFEGCTQLSAVTFEEPCRITTLPYRFLYSDPSLDPDLSLLSLQTFTVPSSVTDVSTAFENFAGTAIECHAGNQTYYSQNGILYKKSDNSLTAFPKGLTSFTVPASMTVIPDKMFKDCINMTSITVESQLTEIGDQAFYNCPITSFNFPNSLVKIGEQAFYGTKLSSVSFTDNAGLTSIGRETFHYIETLQSADLSSLNTLGEGMFRACVNLENVTLNQQMTEIPENTFSGCESLESIVIPGRVTTIGASAFNSCYNLTNVNLPPNLETLGAEAFQNDILIERFDIPASFVNLDYDWAGHAFTSTFGTITVAASNPKFASENGMLFDKDKKTLLHIPGSHTETRIAVPNGVDSIAPFAFYEANNNNGMIKKLTLPASLKSIGEHGLSGAPQLDTLIVKALVPPAVKHNNSLNNEYSLTAPTVIIPPKTKEAYIAAAGWSYWYNNESGDNKDHFVPASIFHDLGLGYASSVSPNGKWIIGDTESSAYIFNNESGVSTIIPNALEARDVNDLGYVAGKFLDSNYMLNGQTPLLNGGVYRNGVWYSLGLGRYGNTTPPNDEFGTNPYAIDAEGNVYGMSADKGTIARVVPFAWKYNASNDNYTTDTLAYATPCTVLDQGGRINDVSSDGRIAAGWVGRHIWGGAWQPILWLSQTNYRVVPSNNFSEAKGVSPNGKYIVLEISNRAAIYDVEKDTTIVFGVEGSSPTAVSDNGFVIGYTARGARLEAGRQAFIWSERLGWTWMRDFIDKYCPDMEIPIDPEYPTIFDFSKTEAIMNVPSSISADGLVIAGWNGYTNLARKGWVINLAGALNLIDRPHNLRATVDITARTKVTLSWDAPANFGTHTLDFYNIYRNGEFLAKIDANDAGTTYVDNNSPVGYNIYTVTAVFDYENSTTYNESGITDEAYVAIVDNYNLPFADSFDYNDFRTNFWESGINTTSGWLPIGNTGFDVAGSAALFRGAGNREPYYFALTSKPLDAAGKDKIILSYMFRIPSVNEEFVGRKDTIAVEIGVNGVWTEVEKYIVNRRYEWTPATLDISGIAADKLFQIRFRAVSGENRNEYNFILDNLGVDFELAAAPTDVKAVKYNNENKIRVYYKDASGSYGFSYTNGKLLRTVGNLGTTFIAAEKLEPKDVKPLAGKYLTSVSAFVNADYQNPATPTQLRLAIFVNGQRVDNTAINSFTGDEWNNFVLSQPIQITGNDTLHVGLEVVRHQSGNAPLTMDNAQDSIFSNSKLLSYNGGNTWSSASAENYYDPKEEKWINFNGAWAITANFRDENAAQEKDDDLMNIAYNVYRNGELLSTLHYGQVFTDTAGFTGSDCYQVKAFGLLGGMSELSEQGCVSILNSLINPQVAQFEVYPNPARSYVNINIDFEKLNVYDAQGRLVTTTRERRIDVGGFAGGPYIIEAVLKDGKRAVARVIVE
jgi:hypothetical protein